MHPMCKDIHCQERTAILEASPSREATHGFAHKYERALSKQAAYRAALVVSAYNCEGEQRR